MVRDRGIWGLQDYLLAGIIQALADLATQQLRQTLREEGESPVKFAKHGRFLVLFLLGVSGVSQKKWYWDVHGT